MIEHRKRGEWGRIIHQSVQLYTPLLKQTFLVVFLFLLFQELVGTLLLHISDADSSFSSLWANACASFIAFLCSVFLLGYLMSAAYSQIMRQSTTRETHLHAALHYFFPLLGVALVQSIVIFLVVIFYVFLSSIAGLEKVASQGVVLGFFLLIAFFAYVFVSQMPVLVIFQREGTWQALKLSVKKIKEHWLLAMGILVFNIILLLLPSFLLITFLSELFGDTSSAVQQVLSIFLSTLIMPMVQLTLLHLYIFLFEISTSQPYQEL